MIVVVDNVCRPVDPRSCFFFFLPVNRLSDTCTTSTVEFNDVRFNWDEITTEVAANYTVIHWWN